MCLDSAFMSIVVKFAVCFFWTVFNTELLLSSLHAHKSAFAVINHMLILNLFKRTVSDAADELHSPRWLCVCLFFGWLFCQRDYTSTHERISSPQIFILYLT